MRTTLPLAMCALALAMPGIAQTTPSPTAHPSETIEVTATRIAEDVMLVPASVTLIDGDELRARNANDLQSALALTGGVAIAPGGEAGPAGSVPEMWGLREFDAFLLVVDGVPWGGAFNPDTPALDLTDVDRIEVVKGSAPVMYGATSFVGVIHVIHREPGSPGMAGVAGGSYGSLGASVSVPLSQQTAFRQSIIANVERKRFRDDDTAFDRLHGLYRAASGQPGGGWRFDADVTALRQDPNSPHPREGNALSAAVPIDANHNPGDAHIDQNRLHLAGGWDAKLGGLPWTSTLAYTHSSFDIVRGFLSEVAPVDPNAFGFSQDRTISDVYFDTHIVKTFSPALRVVAGFDHLYGNAHAQSATFEYFAPLGGGRVDRSGDATPLEEFDAKDRRNFSGLYVSSEWQLSPALLIDSGGRLNRTSERRQTDGPDGPESQSRTFTRLSGSIGANYTVFSRGHDAVALFADYRNTFKPAAIDFGPEAEVDILKPETATSYEAGVKGRFDESRLTWTASMFRMDFRNLLTAATVDGTPVLQNTGKNRFKGAELELEYAWEPAMRAQFAYSYHDSRFVDFVQEFDPGVPTQLAGKRLEMVPHDLIGVGFLYSPGSRFNATATVNYTGRRWLDKRNTAPAAAYTTLNAGVGYRMGRGELRLDGRNLGNRRDPVSESELGDEQYYLLPARNIEVSYRYAF
jgi:iron complex outermembrane receptor protein